MSKPKTPQPAPAENMKRHNVFMPQSHIDGLNTLATTRGGTAADHLRRAVSSYLRRYKIVV